MSLIYMECPVRHTYFSTGVHVDEHTKNIICDSGLIVANCPYCETEHSALLKSVRIVQDEEAA